MVPLIVTNRLTRNFAKKLKLRSEYMSEENKITFLWQHVPALWLEELLDELVENHDSLSAVAIFDYLDKKISDTMKLEPHSERNFKKDIDRKKDDTNIIKNKIKTMESNNEIKNVFSKTFHKSDTASDTIAKKEPIITYAKQYLCADNKDLIYTGLLIIIPLSVFKTLPSHIQDKLVVDDEPLVTVGYHGSRFKQPARIHVDPAASLPLTCYSFLMEVQLNPLTITKNIAHDNLEIDKFGCSYGFNFNQIKDFLSKPESRILVNKSFELGNIIECDFEIKKPFDPKITRNIPLPYLIKDSVKNMLDQEFSLGWLRKLDDLETVFNTNPMIVAPKH
uniref:MATH domain-containing protein n=1 Tax=Strongyloides venezuelensis TaxID=75913 RepID=A0A0K0G4U1_STRVS